MIKLPCILQLESSSLRTSFRWCCTLGVASHCHPQLSWYACTRSIVAKHLNALNQFKFTVNGHKPTNKQPTIHIHVWNAILLVWGSLKVCLNYASH